MPSTWSGWTSPTTSSATFNDVYDKEHLPLLQAVPGIVRGSRYRQPSPTEPRYLAAYELDSAAVLQSPQWRAAGRRAAGRGRSARAP